MLNNTLRKEIVDLIVRGNGGHIPSAFSIVDIINTIYDKILRYNLTNPDDEKRDYFILSKGHGCTALYAVLHKFGFLSDEDMGSYLKYNGILGGHPDRTKIPGAEASSGSLGHGLSYAMGIAHGLRIKNMENKVYVVVGDGECHEGTIWETALVAQNFNLGNLCCIVDLNGSAEQILPHPSIEKQWKSFGWDTVVIDGHDPKQIEATLLSFRDSNNQKPLTVIANTIKGKGLSFMEGHGPWHYKVPNEDEYKVIIEKLNL